MTENDAKKIIELIKSSKRIGLITHKDGDGDAFGSMLASGRVIESMGKKVVFFSNEKLDQIFDFLAGRISYKPTSEYEDVDLVIGLDANSVKRFTIPAILTDAKAAGAKIVIIDHHTESDIDDFADVYYHSTAPCSAAEMVFDLLKTMGNKFDKVTATLLLVGVETDTASLQFNNTKPKTYETVAELLRCGARLKPVVENAFGGRTIASVKLLGRAIDRLVLDKKTGIGLTYITLHDAAELELQKESSSGIANFIEVADVIKVVVVFEERAGHTVKVSLRSNNSEVDVAEIASNFGGGGHVKAAGYEFAGTLEEAINAFKKSQNLLT